MLGNYACQWDFPHHCNAYDFLHNMRMPAQQRTSQLAEYWERADDRLCDDDTHLEQLVRDLEGLTHDALHAIMHRDPQSDSAEAAGYLLGREQASFRHAS